MAIVVALLHLAFAVMTWRAMHPWMPVPIEPTAAADDVLEVRFISAAHVPVAKAQPPIVLPPPLRAPIRMPAKRIAVPNNALSVPLPAPAPAASVATPRLFDRNGALILPAVASSAPAPAYVQRMPQGDTQIMQHTSSVKYQPTQFDKNWHNGSNAIDDALQKAVDKTTVQHTFHVAPGIRIHCGISLVGLAGGCGGDPPPPPSAKDGDVRMNMAPAKPLAANPNTARPPALADCILLYRAGKPLVDGCPSDTPIRAVDEDMREQREKQTKQAASH